MTYTLHICGLLMAKMHVMYNGHIISVKTSGKYKIPKVTATYWKDDETEEEGEQVHMTLWALLVDLVTGDLCMNAIDN